MHTDTLAIAQSPTTQIYCNGNDGIRGCADTTWIYGTALCWLWTNRKYVGIGACFECVVSFYTIYDAKWLHQNCTPAFYSTTIAIPHDSALMLILNLIKCMERYHVGFGRTGRTLVLVYVWICTRHFIPDVRRTMNDMITIHRTLACYSTIMAMTYIRLRADVDFDWIHGTTSRWLWTNRAWVLIGACLNFNVPLFGIPCYMTPSPLLTCLLLKYTTMTMFYGSALMLIEYVERYCVAFDHTGSTLLLVHVWFWTCNCIVYDADWHHRLHTHTHLLIKYTTMAMAFDSALISLAYMERYRVGFGRPVGTLVLVHVWIWMCHYCLVWCAVTPSQLHTHLLCKYNGNDIRFCADLDFDWMHGTISRWRWTNRGYVGIDACVNLNVSLLDIRVYDTTWNHYNCTLTCYSNTLQWQYARLCDDVDWTYGTASCWFWANRKYVGMFGFECIITRWTIHYDTITIARSSTL